MFRHMLWLLSTSSAKSVGSVSWLIMSGFSTRPSSSRMNSGAVSERTGRPLAS